MAVSALDMNLAVNFFKEASKDVSGSFDQLPVKSLSSRVQHYADIVMKQLSGSSISPTLESATLESATLESATLESATLVSVTLEAATIDRALSKLQNRRVSWFKISLACLLSFLLLPAYFAVKWIVENREIQKSQEKLIPLMLRVSQLATERSLFSLKRTQEQLEAVLKNCKKEAYSTQELLVAKQLFQKLGCLSAQLSKQSSESHLSRLLLEYYETRHPARDASNSSSSPQWVQIAKKVDLQIASASACLSKANVALKELKSVTLTPIFCDAPAPVLGEELKDKNQKVEPTESAVVIKPAAPVEPAVVIKPPVSIAPAPIWTADHLPLGLVNVGNSCYLGSILQLIRFNPHLRHLVDRSLPKIEYWSPTLQKPTPHYDQTVKLQSKIRSIFEQLDKGNAVKAAQIKELIVLMEKMGCNDVHPGQAADAQECLGWLLDKLLINTVDKLKGAESIDFSDRVPLIKNIVYLPQQELSSPLSDLLPGSDEKKPAIKLPVNVSEKIDITTMLQLEMILDKESEAGQYQADSSLSSPKTVIDGFCSGKQPCGDLFRVDETDKSPLAEQLRAFATTPYVKGVSPKNSLVVEKNKQLYECGQLYEKKLFMNAPKMLPFHFKRYAFDDMYQPHEIHGAVNTPLELDIQSWLDPSVELKGSSCYELSSIICHLGGFGGGHYLMYQKLSDGQWIESDDHLVSSKPSFDPSSLGGSYMLFYVKKEV